MHNACCRYLVLLSTLIALSRVAATEPMPGIDFFERKIRPLLVEHCYECHSEQTMEQQGGLLLDRESGWLEGGDTAKAVIPGEVESSLLIAAVRYDNDDLQMPPDEPLDDASIKLLEQWVSRGAPAPADDMGETEFSRLGDQEYLFDRARDHWAFQPVQAVEPPSETGIAAFNADWCVIRWTDLFCGRSLVPS